MIDLSELIVNNADYLEQGIEWILVAYIGGNILPNKFVKSVTSHIPLSDILQNYFRGKKKS